MKVLFDVSRLADRVGRSTPSGIDRVDLAYLRTLREMRGVELGLVALDAIGPRLLSDSAGSALIRHAMSCWEPGVASTSASFELLREWLEAPTRRTVLAPRLVSDRPARLIVRRLRSVLSRPRDARRLQEASAPRSGERAVYVNTSHGRLFRTAVASWLRASSARGVFFVHDLIPIEYPEFNRESEPDRHMARLRTIRSHAHAVICNSNCTAGALQRHWHAEGPGAPPIHVLPLGVGEVFKPMPGRPVPEAAVPYFVMLGTIEPRKNHVLILQIWRRLIQRLGDRAPRLVIVGRRDDNGGVLARLLEGTPIVSHVAECSGLTDAEVAALLCGARALLSASFAEGYGLPVAEALALGVPVIASDLPAHREVGGEIPEYIDPLDGLGWFTTIEDYAEERTSRRARALDRVSRYQRPDWSTHFAEVRDVILSAGTTS